MIAVTLSVFVAFSFVIILYYMWLSIIVLLLIFSLVLSDMDFILEISGSLWTVLKQVCRLNSILVSIWQMGEQKL